jgi:hypothetical protein
MWRDSLVDVAADGEDLRVGHLLPDLHLAEDLLRAWKGGEGGRESEFRRGHGSMLFFWIRKVKAELKCPTMMTGTFPKRSSLVCCMQHRVIRGEAQPNVCSTKSYRRRVG